MQTLEPRAFYVYVPYKNQSQAPMFDTAVDDFNFGQLFSVNRYLGNDRIGDANQLTLALTSRLLDPNTGAERLRVAVGQRYYFQNQRVVLNESPRSAVVVRRARRRRGPALRCLGDRRALAVQPGFEADRASARGHPVHAGAGPGLQRELHLFPPVRSTRSADNRG